MKILVVAHPDDEVLWFNPALYDKIIIVFSGRTDKPDFKAKREQAISEHPLNVECWGLTESGYWRDKGKLFEYNQNYIDICERLKTLEADSIDTHSANGEYGHSDHILVYSAIMDTVNCPVNGQDPVLYRQIKDIYKRNGCWTWYF
jgi:LmbE family N-acetylglucosaminyl deacetylase